MTQRLVMQYLRSHDRLRMGRDVMFDNGLRCYPMPISRTFWTSVMGKSISACVGDLTRKVEKSLKLANKKRAFIDQANRLNEGHIPAGVKPFKVSVEVPELNLPIPPELANLTINFQQGCSFREAKEKLYSAATAMNKMLDARIMEQQIEHIRNDITCDFFVGACRKCSEERSSSAARLMQELGIGNPVHQPMAPIPKDRLTALYASVMEKVADNRVIEEQKRQKSEETIAKKVEKLRDTAPHDLLDAKIRVSVQQAMGKKPPSNTDTSIDYGAAYSMLQAQRDDLLRDAIREPPGLEGGSSKQQVFQRGNVPKAKEKKPKGKGKGKDAQNKGKGKSKTKDRTAKGKSKGKKGGSSGEQLGGRQKGGKGKGGRWSSQAGSSTISGRYKKM